MRVRIDDAGGDELARGIDNDGACGRRDGSPKPAILPLYTQTLECSIVPCVTVMKVAFFRRRSTGAVC